MSDMEQIWEKCSLNVLLGSCVKNVQWFRYFSCRVLASPGSTSRSLGKRPPRHLPVPRLQRAQSKIYILRKRISHCAGSDLDCWHRRFEKSEMKGGSLNFITGFLLSWIFWKSTLFTFGEIFLLSVDYWNKQAGVSAYSLWVKMLPVPIHGFVESVDRPNRREPYATWNFYCFPRYQVK